MNEPLIEWGDDSGMNEELEYLLDILTKCKSVLTDDELTYLVQITGANK